MGRPDGERGYAPAANDVLILVTQLSIRCYACMEYPAHNRELLFYERRKDIIRELDEPVNYK